MSYFPSFMEENWIGMSPTPFTTPSVSFVGLLIFLSCVSRSFVFSSDTDSPDNTFHLFLPGSPCSDFSSVQVHGPEGPKHWRHQSLSLILRFLFFNIVFAGGLLHTARIGDAVIFLWDWYKYLHSLSPGVWCVTVPLRNGKVWYHWRSFICEVIQLLWVWTALTQRRFVVLLQQLWPHHLHLYNFWAFASLFFSRIVCYFWILC